MFAAGLVLPSLESGPARLAMAWLVIGADIGVRLYEAALKRSPGYGGDVRNVIILYARFASTIGWPASTLFIDGFGWRGACVAWEALHLPLGLPLKVSARWKAAQSWSAADWLEATGQGGMLVPSFVPRAMDET